jgi:hypothetical protein
MTPQGVAGCLLALGVIAVLVAVILLAAVALR